MNPTAYTLDWLPTTNETALKIRMFLREGCCFICKKGPYKQVAGHISKAHQIGQDELRDMALLRKHDSMSSPETFYKRKAFKVKVLPPVHHGAQPERRYTKAGAQRKALVAREEVN